MHRICRAFSCCTSSCIAGSASTNGRLPGSAGRLPAFVPVVMPWADTMNLASASTAWKAAAWASLIFPRPLRIPNDDFLQVQGVEVQTRRSTLQQCFAHGHALLDAQTPGAKAKACN